MQGLEETVIAILNPDKPTPPWSKFFCRGVHINGTIDCKFINNYWPCTCVNKPGINNSLLHQLIQLVYVKKVHLAKWEQKKSVGRAWNSLAAELATEEPI